MACIYRTGVPGGGRQECVTIWSREMLVEQASVRLKRTASMSGRDGVPLITFLV